ncbi:MAG: DUF1573 domain-containing protein [Alistipes sp.]|nr:DUF1573 domain-containing protein [Alistipes sp.]MDE7069334.1 DUF1573 domain-containing protein [Alistipes sp.]
MRSIACLLLVALLAPGCTPRKARLASQAAGPELRLTDSALRCGISDTLRFGRLYEGESGVRRIRLQNASSQTIVLTHHELSCQCVAPVYERRPLRPDNSMPLEVRFDTRGERGWQMKLLKLYTSESQQPIRLFIEAEVE